MTSRQRRGETSLMRNIANTSDAAAESATQRHGKTPTKKNTVSDKIIHPIVHRLQQNDPKLTSLLILDKGRPDRKSVVFYRPRYEIEDWKNLGEALATNTSLIRLDIKFVDPNSHVSNAIYDFYAKLNKNRSIRRISFEGIHVGNLCQRLLPFFQNNSKLTSLSATNSKLTSSLQLASALSSMTTSLKYLDLSNTGMTDVSCLELLPALLSNHLGLRSLELNGNRIGPEGCAAITIMLGNPSCLLNRLYLDNNRIAGVGVSALCLALRYNNRLKTLSLSGNTNIGLMGYLSFTEALCHAPSINNIISSNHKLQNLNLTLGSSSAAHVLRDTSGLDTSLRFNRSSNNTAYVINRKVITHHFVYNSNMELLERVPGNLIPRVLSTIADYEVFNDERSDEFASNDYIFAKTDYKRLHKAMYHLLRLCPSICERWTSNAAAEEEESVQESNTASNNKRMRLHMSLRDSISPGKA